MRILPYNGTIGKVYNLAQRTNFAPKTQICAQEMKSLVNRLKTIEKSIVGGSNEVLYVLDRDGNVVLDGLKGNANGVDKPVGIKYSDFQGCIATHNHPTNNSFSFQDIKFANESKLQEIRAVCPDVVHSMKFNGKHFNCDDLEENAYDIQKRIQSELLEQHEKIANEKWPCALNGALDPANRDQWMQNYTQKQIYMSSAKDEVNKTLIYRVIDELSKVNGWTYKSVAQEK